jgi:hypothetical protein
MTKALVKNKVGRPSVINDGVVQELVALLQVGGTIEQACAYAGISVRALYENMEINAELTQRIDKARVFTNIEAKRNIADDIINNRDVDTSKWLLEKTEYRPKETTAFSSDGDNTVKFIVTRG